MEGHQMVKQLLFWQLLLSVISLAGCKNYISKTVESKDIKDPTVKGLAIALGPCGVTVGVQNHATWQADRLVGTGDTGAPFQVFSPQGAAFACEKLSLAEWTAISGAAVSTGIGAYTSLGLSLLCGLGNLRLGYWWNSAIRPGRRTRQGSISVTRRMTRFMNWVFPAQTALLDEFTARFRGPHRRLWYLTDGGHFENMGAYEKIRRKVPFIILCDAEDDGDYAFAGLANLVRKARIDFGAEITFITRDELEQGGPLSHIGTLDDLRPQPEGPGKDAHSRAHASLAWIKYSGGETGVLLYLKPTLTGDEPTDVVVYGRAHADFPHETTADQFFDEAQWESYRRLGQHVGQCIFG